MRINAGAVETHGLALVGIFVLLVLLTLRINRNSGARAVLCEFTRESLHYSC